MIDLPLSPKERIRIEQEIVVVNSAPETTGIGIDHLFICNARVFQTPERIKQQLTSQGEEESLKRINELESQGKAEDALEEARIKEEEKTKHLAKYLEKFPVLKYVRVNPPGTMSPVSPSQSIVEKQGGYSVIIDPHFLEQMKLILEKCQDVTLVVPFYNYQRGRERASDIPMEGQQTLRYIAICESLIGTLGEQIQLEIGNEINVTKNTGVMFEDLQFPFTCDPHKYANFYSEVAMAIKTKYPKVRLSIAGTVCFDRKYITTVLNDIKKFERQKRTSQLIDTVSIHPYRGNPDLGAVEIEDGRFKPTKNTYEEQLTELSSLCHQYSPDLQTTIGEINFNSDDPQAIPKLEKANKLTRDHGMISIIYPGIHVHS